MDSFKLHLIGPSTLNIYSVPDGETFSPVLSGSVTFRTRAVNPLGYLQLQVALLQSIRACNSAKTESATRPFAICPTPKFLLRPKQKNRHDSGQYTSLEELVHCDLSNSTPLIKHDERGTTIVVNFSMIIPSNIPGNTRSALGDISYSVDASMTTMEGVMMQTRQDVDIRRSVIADDFHPKHHIRAFPNSNLKAELTLRHLPVSTQEEGVGFAASVLVQGAVPQQSGRASEISYLVIRQIKWSVEETVKLHAAQDAETLGQTCKETHVRKLCHGTRKGPWTTADYPESGLSDYNGSNTQIDIPFDFNIGKSSELVKDVDLCCFKSTPKQRPATSCGDCSADRRLAITVSHQLKLELVTGVDTFSRSNKALVARRNSPNIFGANFPLPVHESAPQDSVPPEMLGPDTFLPKYNDVPGAPPAYIFLGQ